MDPNYKNLLARLGSHPRAAALRPSLESALGISARLTTRRAEMVQSRQYTDSGINAALGDLVPQTLRSLQVAKSPVAKLKRETAAKREALRPAEPDKTDFSGAIERGEMRAHFRSLKPGGPHALLMTTTDLRLIEAAITAPPELSGFTANDRDLVEKIEARYIKLRHPGEVAELETLDAIVAEAEAILAVARNAIRDAANMQPQEFEREAAKVERAVWIVGASGAERVCEVQADGTAEYRVATADEVATGRSYASAAEYMTAKA